MAAWRHCLAALLAALAALWHKGNALVGFWRHCGGIVGGIGGMAALLAALWRHCGGIGGIVAALLAALGGMAALWRHGGIGGIVAALLTLLALCWHHCGAYYAG